MARMDNLAGYVLGRYVFQSLDCFGTMTHAILLATLRTDAELVTAARAYVNASRAHWRSMMRPPFNEYKGTGHWQLAKDAAVAWQAWVAALADRCIESDDRRGLAVALVQGQEEEE